MKNLISTVEIEQSFDNNYLLDEIKHEKTKNKNIDRELRGDLEKLVEKENIDREYQRFLHIILGKAEKDEQNKENDETNEKDERDNLNMKAESSKKRTHRKFRKVEAESSVAHINNNNNENDLEKGGDGNDSDIEILDNDAVLKTGIFTSFVPNMRFINTTEDDDSKQIGSPSDRFRKQVLDVLTKPFDDEELKRLREAVRGGSYYRHYPDFERKLKKHRYKRQKCLTILRGFFFWLQNVSQEGSFKPWKDGQCLAAEPGSPENSHLDRAK